MQLQYTRTKLQADTQATWVKLQHNGFPTRSISAWCRHPMALRPWDQAGKCHERMGKGVGGAPGFHKLGKKGGGKHGSSCRSFFEFLS